MELLIPFREHLMPSPVMISKPFLKKEHWRQDSQIFPPIESWLINSNFRRTNRIQGGGGDDDDDDDDDDEDDDDNNNERENKTIRLTGISSLVNHVIFYLGRNEASLN